MLYGPSSTVCCSQFFPFMDLCDFYGEGGDWLKHGTDHLRQCEEHLTLKISNLSFQMGAFSTGGRP